MSSAVERLVVALAAGDDAPTPPRLVPLTHREQVPPLRPYQAEAVQWLRDRPRAGLFLDMGLGKTRSTLEALTEDHLPVLVLAPPRVATHEWGRELERWRPDLSFASATVTPARREFAVRAGADVTAASYDSIPQMVELVRKYGRTYRTVVLDELSGFKNTRTRRWKGARKLTRQATYVWGLTGTPAPNGLMDLWGQCALVDDGATFGRNKGAFLGKYFWPERRLPSGTVTKWGMHEGAAEDIMAALEPRYLSMTSAGRVSLPPVVYSTIHVQPSARVAKLHATLKRDALLELGDQVVTAATAAAVTNKLQQITAGWLLDESGSPIHVHDAKLDALAEVVESPHHGGVLVLYGYRAEREAVLERVPEAMPADEPGAIERWNLGELPVLVAHPRTLAYGLNLQSGGHTMVWLTLPWALELWLQTNARLARSGQQHPVVIHTIEMSGTVDELLPDVLGHKRSVQSALMTWLEK